MGSMIAKPRQEGDGLQRTQPSPSRTVTNDVRTGGKGQDGRRAFAAADTPAMSLNSNLADPSKKLSNY